MTGETVLITGGAGFVAAHTARAFGHAGLTVALADVRTPAPSLARLHPPGTRLFQVDVTDPDDIARAVTESGATGIVHTAAVVGVEDARSNPTLATRVNVLGTQHVLEVARASGLRVTYLSTATLYGTRPDLQPLRENLAPDPVGIYDATKLMGETLALAYHRTWGVDVAIVRPGFVYGYGARIGEYFLPRALAGEAIHESVGGDHPCDFTYVADLAGGLLRAHTVRPIQHRIFNITGGQLSTRGELAAVVRALVPGAQITVGPGVDPARHLRGASDLSLARAELGYQPQFDLAAGMAEWTRMLREANSHQP